MDGKFKLPVFKEGFYWIFTYGLTQSELESIPGFLGDDARQVSVPFYMVFADTQLEEYYLFAEDAVDLYEEEPDGFQMGFVDLGHGKTVTKKF